MKQLLSLALALLPCLAWAQYPSNGNQKITLGEQTTADGLIWRGVASDTTKTVKTDTSAWIVLDTANSIMYHYDSSSVGRKWLRLNLLPSDTTSLAYVNTYGTQTVNGAKTFSSTVTGARFDPTSSSATGNGLFLPSTNVVGLSVDGIERLRINSSGNLGLGVTPSAWRNIVKSIQIGNIASIFSFNNTTYDTGLNLFINSGGDYKYITTAAASMFRQSGIAFEWYNAASGSAGSTINLNQVMTLDGDGDLGIGAINPVEKLHVVGNVRITGLANAANPVAVEVDDDGKLIRASSYNLKENIHDIPYGLTEVMNFKPVVFNYIKKSYGEKRDVGFIAQDIESIIPEAVGTGPDSEIFLDRTKLIPILTKAIQEQQALIKALEQRIINLENK